jgi:hypothetical protein
MLKVKVAATADIVTIMIVIATVNTVTVTTAVINKKVFRLSEFVNRAPVMPGLFV